MSLITIFLSLVVLNHTVAAPVMNSNYDYVPNELRVASALNQNKNNTEKELSDKALTNTQKKGMVEGKSVVESMLSQAKSNNNDTPFLNEIINQNQQTINRTYQDASHNVINNNESKLYYFISFSMPDAIIKSYMLDAIWNGGILVVRGAPRGMTLAQFLQQYIMPLVRYKGDHAKIEINPNLYEIYDVQVVPTILIAKGKEKENRCERIIATSTSSKVTYPSCKKIGSTPYWKISGNVTTRWALNMLKESGAPAQIFINRMQRLNQISQKEEKGFQGDWQKAPLPTSDDIVLAFLAKYGLQQALDGLISRKNDNAKTL